MIPATRIETLNLETLQIDPEYQRPLKPHAKRIARKFRADAVGTLLVGVRADGTCWLVDGQQRRHALLALGYTQWPCSVFVSEGRAHEAAVFVAVNGTSERVTLRPRELFRSRIQAGDPLALELRAAVESLGLRFSTRGGGWPNLACVGGLYQAASTLGVPAVREALAVVTTAWPEHGYALNITLILAVMRLVQQYPQVDTCRLAAQLRRVAPERVFQEAGMGLIRDRVAAVVRVMIRLYNRNLRSGRLPVPELEEE